MWNDKFGREARKMQTGSISDSESEPKGKRKWDYEPETLGRMGNRPESDSRPGRPEEWQSGEEQASRESDRIGRARKAGSRRHQCKMTLGAIGADRYLQNLLLPPLKRSLSPHHHLCVLNHSRENHSDDTLCAKSLLCMWNRLVNAWADCSGSGQSNETRPLNDGTEVLRPLIVKRRIVILTAAYRRRSAQMVPRAIKQCVRECFISLRERDEMEVIKHANLNHMRIYPFKSGSISRNLFRFVLKSPPK
jgi:hypothetical protein